MNRTSRQSSDWKSRGPDVLRRWARDRARHLSSSRLLRGRELWPPGRRHDGESSELTGADLLPWNHAIWRDFSPWNEFAPSFHETGLHEAGLHETGLHEEAPGHAHVPPKDDHRLRFFSLNVAHGRRHSPENPFYRRSTVQRNISAIADTVKTLTPDVVALQEADGPSSWSGNFDHVASLAQQTELASHYRGDHNQVSLGKLSFPSGTALLSKRPLQDPLSHRFGMSWRDTKGFVVATVAVPEWGGVELDVVSVHLDFLIPHVRRKQILHMVEHLVYRRRPLVVLGDFNCCFEREPASMGLLADTLGLRAHAPRHGSPTFPARRPRRRLDWILISEDLEFGGHHTVQVPLSDHLVLVADLHLKSMAPSS